VSGHESREFSIHSHDFDIVETRIYIILYLYLHAPRRRFVFSTFLRHKHMRYIGTRCISREPLAFPLGTRVLDQRIDFPTNDTSYNNDIHNIDRVYRCTPLQELQYVFCVYIYIYIYIHICCQ